MILEICANSYQSALNAQIVGAHRIELCSELSVGGITPSLGFLKKVAKEITIPVNVLIRPRSGDFCYSNDEFEIMKENIITCKKLGLSGIVSGILQTNNSIDIERTKELIELANPLSFTFHRAFDCVSNPKKSLEQLIDLGVGTILTSGQKPKAIEGINLLSELQKIAKNKLTILAGGGINPKNAKEFKNAGLREIHASASKVIQPLDKNPYFGDVQTVSDIEIIKEILNVIN